MTDPASILRAADDALNHKLGPKLRCPTCGRYTSRVLPRSDLQRNDEAYRRLRQCVHCQTRYTTVEQVERIIERRSA